MKHLKTYKIFESTHDNNDGTQNVYYDSNYPDKDGEEKLFHFVEPFIDMYDDKWHFSVALYRGEKLEMELTAPGAWDDEKDGWVARNFVLIRELNRKYDIDKYCEMVRNLYGFKLSYILVYGADMGIRIDDQYKFNSFADFMEKYEAKSEEEERSGKLSHHMRVSTNGFKIEFIKE